jgi:1-deoxy-D-xylulose-5-phosphate reductoisomerase
LIEACYLFDLPQEQIEILVHPESIIHGMVAYKDGSYLAQLGCPDMKAPISYALNFGERLYQNPERLDFKKLASLHFEDLDETVFKGPSLARQALNSGAQMPIIMNAANEIGVENFLKDQIGFLDIVNLVEEVMSQLQIAAPNSMEDVLEIDRVARDKAEKLVASFATV